MKSLSAITALLLMAGLCCVPAASAQVIQPPPDQAGNIPSDRPAADEDILMPGPIHEAFAEPVNTGAVQPLVVPQRPPEPIDEMPPDAKPADEDSIWIGGYWAWSNDRPGQ